VAPWFDRAAETMPVAERRRLQGHRLHQLVERLAGASPFWRDRLAGVELDRVRTVDDLGRLPFTTKDDLRAHYPYGGWAMPREAAVRIHASSGTSGQPTIVGYTRADVRLFAELNARALVCAGATPADVVHVAYGYGLFTGGLGLHYGSELLGATTVPASGGNSTLQLRLLVDLGADVLACTPSFAMLLAERAAAEGITGLRLRHGVFGAEPWSESMRTKLEQAYSSLTGRPFTARDIYGLSEVIGPGVAMECVAGPGALHVFDDHFVPEIVDPLTGSPAQPGDAGELVLTTLTKQAMPVVRYRTGDVTRLVDGPCPCGRTHQRIGRFEGRVDDMLIVRGVNVFPAAIEQELLADPDLGAGYALVLDRRETLTRLEVRCELADPARTPDPRPVEDRVTRRLASALRVGVTVRCQPPGSLPRTETGKARRVFVRVDDTDPLAP
jgi:phenylacetate-CoA ligase